MEILTDKANELAIFFSYNTNERVGPLVYDREAYNARELAEQCVDEHTEPVVFNMTQEQFDKWVKGLRYVDCICGEEGWVKDPPRDDWGDLRCSQECIDSDPKPGDDDGPVGTTAASVNRDAAQHRKAGGL